MVYRTSNNSVDHLIGFLPLTVFPSTFFFPGISCAPQISANIALGDFYTDIISFGATITSLTESKQAVWRQV